MNKNHLKLCLELALDRIQQAETEMLGAGLSKPYVELIDEAADILESFGAFAGAFPQYSDESPVALSVPLSQLRVAQKAAKFLRDSIK